MINKIGFPRIYTDHKTNEQEVFNDRYNNLLSNYYALRRNHQTKRHTTTSKPIKK